VCDLIIIIIIVTRLVYDGPSNLVSFAEHHDFQAELDVDLRGYMLVFVM